MLCHISVEIGSTVWCHEFFDIVMLPNAMCAESGLLVPNWCVIVIENVLLCIVDINLVNSIEMSSEQNLNSSLKYSVVLCFFSKIAK